MAAASFTATLYKPTGGTANATVSSQLETNFLADEVAAGYYDHSVDSKERWVGIAGLTQISKYRVYEHARTTPGSGETTATRGDYTTMTGACDAAAAFLDTATDP